MITKETAMIQMLPGPDQIGDGTASIFKPGFVTNAEGSGSSSEGEYVEDQQKSSTEMREAYVPEPPGDRLNN